MTENTILATKGAGQGRLRNSAGPAAGPPTGCGRRLRREILRPETDERRRPPQTGAHGVIATGAHGVIATNESREQRGEMIEVSMSC